jgi:hypothetical protein
MTRRDGGAAARTAKDLLSPDLLNGLEGIEQGLRRRRSLGRAGGIGLVALATIQLGLGISSLLTNVSWGDVMGQWYVFVAATIVAGTLALFVALRYWIKESRTAFRYTCRIVEFEPVAGAPKDAVPTLRHDLAELLNDRIGRISFLDQEPESPEQAEAHVHVAGAYLVRWEESPRRHLIEITPRVRVGGPTASETLAHTVRYELPENEDEAPGPLGLTRDDTDKILEHVYFSVATRLYKQIQGDVERKIDLLPTRYLRATAYMYEAEDYAQSNTLDAYDDAQVLFEKARFLYDPGAGALPTARFRRLGALVRRPARWVLNAVRGAFSHLFPRLAKRDAMLARTELGLANTLVARRGLARLSGRRINQIFAARAVAESSLTRLKRLARIGYRGADETLFDARVTLALVLHYLGSDERAEAELERARASLPDRAEENARYLFAAALVEPRTTSALSLLRRAVELSPRFEVAQFERARRTETLWHFRPDLERTVAETVLAEYRNVVRINPGNVQAWSSLGHTRWLLVRDGDERELRKTQRVFERGLEYKEIKRETFVAGLRYSLARVAAERGEFADAYGHYVASTTASVGEGIAHGSWAEQHNSVVRNEAILKRFADYVARVEQKRAEAEEDGTVERRVLRSVQAFVENDYGEACMNFFERTGREKYLRQAFFQFEKARKTNPTYVVPSYNLCLLNRFIGDLDAAHEQIQSVRRREPKWPEALLEKMMVEAWISHGPAEQWAELESEIDALNSELETLTTSLKAVRKNYLASDLSEDSSKLLGSGLGADATEIVAAWSPLDELRARIGVRRERLERLEKERDEIESDLREAARQTEKTVHGLVPHEWLWKGGEFRWKKVPKPRGTIRHRRRKSDERWVQDFGDLHARALEAWAHTRALSRVDETERHKLSRGGPRRTDRLLRHLEACFWPDREEGLAARLLLGADPSLEERLGSLAARSLAFDPANYRLLLTADTYLPIQGGGAKKKRKAFVEALRTRDVPPPLLAWLGPRLENLELYDCAREAYGGAEKGRAGVDRATLLLGKARAAWGACSYQEAVATLALVSRSEGVAAWRKAFVDALAERGQLQNGTESALRVGEANGRRDNGRRRMPGISGLRLSRRDRAQNGYENEASAPVEAAQESDACQTLVRWLEGEHAARVAAADVLGAEDAAQALLLITAARRGDSAPNRTTPLPDVSAPTGDEQLDREASVVPLIRHLAVEAHPTVFSDHEEQLRELVQEHLPEVRRTIERERGVPVPLPSISRNDYLLPGSFRVLANELLSKEGSIGADGSYSPMVEAIREAIEENLTTLVGLDEVIAALTSLSSSEDDLAARMLDDDMAKMRLLFAVRALIADGIRVDFEELIRDLEDGGQDVDVVVDSIRARRQSGADADAERVALAKASLEGPSWAVSR